MTFDRLRRASDHRNIWHRRGLLGFAGSVLLMLIAARLTDSLDVQTVIRLVEACAVVAVLAALLKAGGQLAEQWSLLLWPVATVATLVGYSWVNAEAAALLVGLIGLAFLHIGLSQPPGRGLWLLLPAAVSWLVILDLDVTAAAIRLPLALLIWGATSELPSRLLTEVRGQREVLRIAATTDTLTGLLNRSTLADRVQGAAVGSAVAVIDIDHFKQFNDTHGHLAGDVVLTDFAAMLGAQCRAEDSIFRYGGEEFLVIFHELPASDAAVVVERFADAWSAHPSRLSFSAGVSPLGVDGIRMADELLYKAKRNGRSRVFVERRESA